MTTFSEFYCLWMGKEFGPESALELFEAEFTADSMPVKIGSDGKWITFGQLKNHPLYLAQVRAELDARLAKMVDYKRELDEREAEIDAEKEQLERDRKKFEKWTARRTAEVRRREAELRVRRARYQRVLAISPGFLPLSHKSRNSFPRGPSSGI